MLSSIDELNQMLKRQLLKIAISPLLSLLLLLSPNVRKFLTVHILPILSQRTLWILMLLFAYLCILLFLYTCALCKKIKDNPTLEILQFKEWEETKKQYETKELYGHFFQVKRTSLESGGKPQYACPSCYQDKKESILNCEIEPTPKLGRFLCPVCGKCVDWNNFDYSTQKKFPII